MLPFGAATGTLAAPAPAEPRHRWPAACGRARSPTRTSRWAFGGRLLVNLGNAFGTTYLLFFLRDYLKVADPDGSLIVLTLIYLVFTLAATYGGGILSDRTGRRRIFVAVASVAAGAAPRCC